MISSAYRELVIIILLLTSLTTHTETLTVVSDVWCPYTCEPDAINQGIGVDIVKAVFEPLGIDIHYQVGEWEQTLQWVKEGKYDAVISVIKKEAPYLLFPKYHFSHSKSCFFQHSSSQWQYAGTSSLNNKRIGIMSGYSYGRLLDKYFVQHNDSIKKKTTIDDLLTALDNNKVDIINDDYNVLTHYITTYKPTEMQSNYSFTGCQPRTKLFIAFSPANKKRSEHFVKLLDERLYEILRNGEAQAIHEKYGIQER